MYLGYMLGVYARFICLLYRTQGWEGGIPLQPIELVLLCNVAMDCLYVAHGA